MGLEYLLPLTYILIVVALSYYIEVLDKKSPRSSPTPRTDLEVKKFNIQQEIKKLSKEADRYNTPDTFVKHAKLQRMVNKKTKELGKIGKEIEEAGGDLDLADRLTESTDSLFASIARNKMLVAIALSFAFSFVHVDFKIDPDHLYPLELLIGTKVGKDTWRFTTNFFFSFMIVRFSNRLSFLLKKK